MEDAVVMTPMCVSSQLLLSLGFLDPGGELPKSSAPDVSDWPSHSLRRRSQKTPGLRLSTGSDQNLIGRQIQRRSIRLLSPHYEPG